MTKRKIRPGLGFRHRVYLWVLALFLVFFNATVLGVAWPSNDRAFASQRDKLLTEQQFIVQSLAEDISLIAASRPLGLPLLTDASIVVGEGKGGETKFYGVVYQFGWGQGTVGDGGMNV